MSFDSQSDRPFKKIREIIFYSKLDELTIGITIPEIQNIDTVIAIAGGLEKLNVILGALSGQLINVLITDRETSEAILQS